MDGTLCFGFFGGRFGPVLGFGSMDRIKASSLCIIRRGWPLRYGTGAWICSHGIPLGIARIYLDRDARSSRSGLDWCLWANDGDILGLRFCVRYDTLERFNFSHELECAGAWRSLVHGVFKVRSGP